MPQPWSQKHSVTSAKYLAKDHDPHFFYGSRKALSVSGTFTDATNYVNNYVWRYGSTYYPQAHYGIRKDDVVICSLTPANVRIKEQNLLKQQGSLISDPKLIAGIMTIPWENGMLFVTMAPFGAPLECSRPRRISPKLAHDISVSCTIPPELRGLFVMILEFNAPSDPARLLDAFLTP